MRTVLLVLLAAILFTALSWTIRPANQIVVRPDLTAHGFDAAPVFPPPPDGQIVEGMNPASEIVIATRLFAGPGQIPPEGYKAFGVLAFPERATAESRDRYMQICQAFLGTVPHTSEVQGNGTQIVTIWPTENAEIALRANSVAREDTCDVAVDGYGLALGHEHLAAARASGAVFGDGRGPFLIAWAPGQSHGQPGADMLIRNLSLVVSEQQAREEFRGWIGQIERSPEFWSDLPKLEQIRRTLRDWADYYGPLAKRTLTQILQLNDEKEAG